MTVDHQALHVLHRRQSAAALAVGILLRLQVGLEDRLQDHQHRRLYDTVLDRWNPQRSLLAVRLGNIHPPHGLRTVALLFEFFREYTQPSTDARRLDLCEGFAVHARFAAVGTTAFVGVAQHIPTIDLVVQRVEPIVRRLLRFGLQRRLEFPNLRWRY